MKKGDHNTLFAMGVFAWVVVVFIIHNQLWGGYEIHNEDLLLYVLFDGIGAACAVGAFLSSGESAAGSGWRCVAIRRSG